MTGFAGVVPRRAFAGLPMKRVTMRYTVGGMGRGRQLRGELIITNFRPG